VTAIYPDTADLRECRLYRFYGWDPRTNYTTKTLVYLGETLQEAFDRLLQNVGRQPWADTITSWEVDDRVFADKEAVVRAEKAAVEDEKPLYNDEWNRGNDQRVSLEDAKLQRWARDDARGVPRWRPKSSRTMYRQGQEVPVPATPGSRAYGQVPSRPARRSPVRQKRPPLKPWQKRTIGWGSAWLVSTLVLWLLDLLRWHLGGWVQALIGSASALPAAVLLFCLVLTWTAKPRTRRKVWRAMTGIRW
jgi:hypothetical protein